jgi:protein SCO1/2
MTVADASAKREGAPMLRLLLMFAMLIAVLPNRTDAHPSFATRDSAVSIRPSDVTSEAGPKQRAARIFFSDRRLVTQHGETVQFYTDVLRDRTVLIHFIFTQCTDSCPTQTARVAAVQSLLPDAARRRIAFVSISVDPEHDTPQALDEYATRFGARPGWTFLTGSKANVDDVLRRVGQLAPSRESHTTLFILGNVKSGHWIKVHPDADPKDIAAYLLSLAAETGADMERR